MTISCLIITKNRRKKLLRTLFNLCYQTVLPDEVIIVDDITEKKSISIKEVRKIFPKRVAVTISQVKYSNYAKSRNKALGLSSSEIIVFVDDDVLLEKDYIKKTRNIHMAYDLFALVGPVYSIYDSIWSGVSSLYYMQEKKLFKKLTKIGVYPGAAISYKRSQILNHNMKFEERTYTGEDVIFTSKASSLGLKMYFHPNLSVKHDFSPFIKDFFATHYKYGFDFIDIEILINTSNLWRPMVRKIYSNRLLLPLYFVRTNMSLFIKYVRTFKEYNHYIVPIFVLSFAHTLGLFKKIWLSEGKYLKALQLR